MPLQDSGQISLDDIHVEAGGSTGTEAGINDSDIRGLIGASSATEMEFSDFYSASSAAEFKFALTASDINDHDDISFGIGNATPAIADGDLIVVAVSSDDTLTYAPTGPSQMINAPNMYSANVSYPGHYVEYGFYNSSMGNYLSFNGSPVGYAISAVCAVFSGVTQLTNYSTYRYGTSGMPNPNSIASASPTKLIVITGHLDDDAVTMTAPTGYTMAGTKSISTSGWVSSTGIAYKITNTSQAENAGAFGGGGSDANFAYGFRFG